MATTPRTVTLTFRVDSDPMLVMTTTSTLPVADDITDAHVFVRSGQDAEGDWYDTYRTPAGELVAHKDGWWL